MEKKKNEITIRDNFYLRIPNIGVQGVQTR